MKIYATIYLLCTVPLTVCIAQPTVLPKPSGQYGVGVDYLCFTDTARKERFDNQSERHRALTVKAWYPADEEPGTSAPYFYDADTVINMFAFPEIYRELITHAGRSIPLSTAENSFPVVIFNHGWGEHFAQNTILMEALASHGYVVFSMAHHYECKFSFYPDGRFISIDANSQRFRQIMHEQHKPEAIDLIIKMRGLERMDDQKQILIEQSNTLPTLLKETPSYWAADISFFLDQLELINENNPVYQGKLNLNQIGMMGMSMGGIATNEICMSDRRVKAGVNMDGGLTGPQLDQKIQTPFMFLNGNRYVGYGELLTRNVVKDGYSFSVKGADHYNFTDYSIYTLKSLGFLMGTIEGKRTIEIMNDLVVAFFDRYLKQKKNIDLIQRAQCYPEIEIQSNIHSTKISIQ